MAKEVWKEYEENQLSHSAAHYLMTIHELLEDRGYARVTDIARRLSITRGSCSISLKALKRRGLVEEDDNKFLLLSAEGRRLAALVERNDELLETFFREVLGVDETNAEIDACKIEHLLSIESSRRLASFIACIQSDEASAGAFRELLRVHQAACTADADTCELCAARCIEKDGDEA